jgi:CubicO group peptidase (beta-lactamase class C family)
MRTQNVFLLLALTIAAAAQQSNITRLDGSKLATSEIDATVARVMHAAEVTGVGLAIFDKGQVVYLKTYGVRDKEKKPAVNRRFCHDRGVLQQSGVRLHGASTR